MPEITRHDIEIASERIAPHVRRTPVVEVEPGLGGMPGCRLTLKLDFLQPTGSFKVRGAFNHLLGTAVPADGVVASSGGNFGLAVAHAARELGVPATVFVPSTSPVAKIDRLRDLGAAVRVVEGYYADAHAASVEWRASRDVLVCHPYDQPRVVAGQGTCGREILAQVPDADAVLVAVGGGGLIGGIASWIREDARVVGVETAGTPALHAARRAGGPVDVDVGGVAASSLGAPRIGAHAWSANRWIDDAVLVADEAIDEARRWLWEAARLVAEPGALTPLAALLTGAWTPPPDARVVALVCGANVGP
ncbi:MAG: threonine/serine dehydratase [Acidimicrobiia bacterium]|nr:threonine/serine dehydratase [Acidimicrobiia bacterium]